MKHVRNYIGIQLPTINDLIYYWVIKFVLSFLIHFFTTLINISTITQKKTIFFLPQKTSLARKKPVLLFHISTLR